MGTVMVSQIDVTPLKRISVEGGDVLHAIKYVDPGYVGFGEAYFSQVEKGAIKAWKRHFQMTLNLVVPVGLVRFVFFDELGTVREETIGEDNYVRLTVPPGIWSGFCGMSDPLSLILNVADITHDPTEVDQKNLAEFNYSWN